MNKRDLLRFESHLQALYDTYGIKPSALEDADAILQGSGFLITATDPIVKFTICRNVAKELYKIWKSNNKKPNILFSHKLEMFFKFLANLPEIELQIFALQIALKLDRKMFINLTPGNKISFVYFSNQIKSTI